MALRVRTPSAFDELYVVIKTIKKLEVFVELFFAIKTIESSKYMFRCFLVICLQSKTPSRSDPIPLNKKIKYAGLTRLEGAFYSWQGLGL